MEEAAATGNRTRRQQEEEKKTPREPQKRHGRGRKARRGAGQGRQRQMTCTAAPPRGLTPFLNLTCFFSPSLSPVLCVFVVVVAVAVRPAARGTDDHQRD